MNFVNNAAKVKAKIRSNQKNALEAMGKKAVDLTKGSVLRGYGSPIWKTGALYSDIRYGNLTEESVEVGNSDKVPYSVYVHDGTSRMAGRPYLRDALTQGAAQLKEIAAEKLKEGVE